MLTMLHRKKVDQFVIHNVATPNVFIVGVNVGLICTMDSNAAAVSYTRKSYIKMTMTKWRFGNVYENFPKLLAL